MSEDRARWDVPLAYERVVVTGGGSGIGRALALTLAGSGATAYVLGRRRERLDETVELAAGSPGRVVAIGCDVREPAQLDEAFSSIEANDGPPQALVHCALSVPGYAPAEKITPEVFREVVDSVLVGAFNALQRWSQPLLRDGLPGTAVALTSAMATRGTPGTAHSSASKAGIEAFVKSAAREWGPRGITLNVVGPGFFPVDRTRAMFEAGAPGDRIVAQTALGRVGELHEVVGPIMFLLSTAASYVTGHVLIPDGGFRLTPAVLPAWEFEEGPR